MDRGGESFFYHTDGLGSITGITDSSKQTVASYGYDAFGNITSQTGSLNNSYTYTGREYDPESGLYYYRAKYYDPTVGRFLQPDPLDMAMVILIRQYFPGNAISRLLFHSSLGNPLTISNVYPYVGNNPINWMDPLGFKGFAIDAGGGFGTGWGEQDPTAVGFFAGTGVYIGAKPEKGYHAEIGGFTYQGRGKTPGARLGLGINFTRYHIDAEKFFRGEYKYVMMTIILVTHTRYYNPRGETIGWTISLFGRGLGLTWFEEGCVKGSSIALQ